MLENLPLFSLPFSYASFGLDHGLDIFYHNTLRQQDLAETIRIPLCFPPAPVSGADFHPPSLLVKGFKWALYSNSNVVLQAPQWTHLPACVSMETRFVHAPLQLVSLTSISAEGRLA